MALSVTKQGFHSQNNLFEMRARFSSARRFSACVVASETVGICVSLFRRRDGRDKSDISAPLWTGLYVFLGINAAIFVALLARCAWSVSKDPLTPLLAQGLWARLQDAVSGKPGKRKRRSSAARPSAGKGGVSEEQWAAMQAAWHADEERRSRAM